MSLPKEYSILFNGVSNTIEELEVLLVKLRTLQQQAEDAYLDESSLITMPNLPKSV